LDFARYYKLGSWETVEELLLETLIARVQEDVEAAISGSQSLDQKDLQGRSLLHRAAEVGSGALVKSLLDHNANPLTQDGDGSTPLDFARHFRTKDFKEVEGLLLKALEAILQAEVDRLLVENRAGIDTPDEWGKSLVHKAAEIGSESLVEKLMANNANPDIVDKDGWFALFAASKEGYSSVVEALIKGGCGLDLRGRGGNTSVMTASFFGQSEVVARLIEGQADLNLTNQKGETALDRALGSGSQGVEELLRVAGGRLSSDL